ncbi:O-antigen translocase [Pantoea sp. GM01]|uniref:O-antigen translocase n=1 Tax=Pantoea sp. GM01 TaxID=1144320 RepID=UPI000271435D|nr:O-antigen translocase [Pantoea sp. GM01]EJL89601.1 membrane protein involved in the export of O-antigen and teichoic acid [Pantoea sp. GM01]
MRKMLSVTLSTALLTFYRILSQFIIAKLVAIYTGPTGIAMLGQLQSLFSLLNGVVVSPVGNSIVRYTSENIDAGFGKTANWWRAAILCSSALFLFSLPLCLYFRDFLAEFLFQNYNYNWLIILSCFMLPMSIINTAFISVINGLQQYKKFILVGFVSVTVSTILVLFLIYKYHIVGALIAATINTSLSGVIVLIVSFREPWLKLRFWLGRVKTRYIYDILKYAAMAITSAIAAPLALMFVRKILVSHVGWSTTGQWQAVWKISEVYLSIITLALSTYYLPQLSKLTTANEIKREINSAIKIILPIVTALSLAVFFMRDIIIKLLFTNEFAAARELFSVQLIGDVIKITAWLYAFPMISKGAIKWFISSEIFFSFTFVLFTYFFVSKIGVNGANWAYLTNYGLYFIFVYLNLNKIIGLPRT